MEKEKCVVLVNSCDSYEDVWNPFFKLLKKYWPTRKFPIVLNTETKQYEYEDMNIQVINLPDKLKNNQYITWGKRMIEAIKRIDAEYILFMLDDFFLLDYVEEERIDEVIRWMDEDQNITVFSFRPVSKSEYEDTPSQKYKGYALRNKKGPYRYNCQAAIWRRQDLLEALSKYESPWDWELIGNRRSEKTNKEFYTIMSKEDMIFKYNILEFGTIRGKWALPKTKEIFERENIEMDFDIRNKPKEEQERKEKEKISKAKEKGKIYYFIYRAKNKLIRMKNKIIVLWFNR